MILFSLNEILIVFKQALRLIAKFIQINKEKVG